MPDRRPSEPNSPGTEPESRLLSDAPARETDVREVVGLFPDVHALEHGVEELLTAGFDQGDISLLAGEKTVREKLGHRLDDTLSAADDPEAPRRAYVAPESRMEGRGALAAVLGYFGAVTAMGITFATGGLAAPAIGAALVGGGAGAGLGVGLGRLYSRHVAEEFSHQIDKGGILVWVRIRDADDERRAAEVLTRHGAHHVHAHTMPLE